AEPCSARTAASATASASRDGASSRSGLWYPYRSFHSYSCGPAVRICCRLKGRIPGLTGLRRELGRVGYRAAIGPQPAPTRDESVAARARGDGSMYHICPPQCQIQFLSGQLGDHRNGRYRVAEAFPQRPGELSSTVLGRLRGVDASAEPALGDRRLDLGKAGDDGAGLVRERERLAKILAQ